MSRTGKLSIQAKILWTLLSRGGTLKLGKMAEITKKSEKHLKYRVLPVMMDPKLSPDDSDHSFSPMLKEVKSDEYALTFYSDVQEALRYFKKRGAKRVGWNDFQNRLRRMPTEEEKSAALQWAAQMGMEMGSKTVYPPAEVKTYGPETPAPKWRCPSCGYEDSPNRFIPMRR